MRGVISGEGEVSSLNRGFFPWCPALFRNRCRNGTSLVLFLLFMRQFVKLAPNPRVGDSHENLAVAWPEKPMYLAAEPTAPSRRTGREYGLTHHA